MRIYDVSCSIYSEKRTNPTFGFWYSSMSNECEKSIGKKYSEYIYKHKTIKAPKDNNWLLGQLNKSLDKYNLDDYKKRHVNIQGSQEKINRITFNRYSPKGIIERYQQDLYPNGDLITQIKIITNKGVKKIEEFIENIK